MIGLFISVTLFNIIAFKTTKLNKNQIIHIWLFTIVLQVCFDVIIDFKFSGYWYFKKDEIEWVGLIPHILLVPPVNIMFLNWYPFTRGVMKRLIFIVIWVISILIYECITLLPEPWGYFRYGWWSIWHSAIMDPILLFILLKYYKYICKVEKQICN